MATRLMKPRRSRAAELALKEVDGKRIRKGDTITMDFHCAGLVSHEDYTVARVRRDGTIVIDNDPPMSSTRSRAAASTTTPSQARRDA